MFLIRKMCVLHILSNKQTIPVNTDLIPAVYSQSFWCTVTVNPGSTFWQLEEAVLYIYYTIYGKMGQ